METVSKYWAGQNVRLGFPEQLTFWPAQYLPTSYHKNKVDTYSVLHHHTIKFLFPKKGKSFLI